MIFLYTSKTFNQKGNTMAIYKGRDVTLLQEIKQPQTTPIHIMIRYQDGQTDYVPLEDMQLTSDEKKSLEKANMSRYDNVKVIEPIKNSKA
jgi:hypothetical protein